MQPEFVLKPSLKKVTLLNVLKVIFAVVLIFGVLFYLSVLVDLSVFTEAFGITNSEMPSLSRVLVIFSLAAIVTSIITIIISYVSTGKKQLVFFLDRLESYTNILIFNVGKEEILYDNISSIRGEMSFGDHLVKTGTLIFELTGLKKKSISFEYVDNAEQYLPYIQKLLDAHRANYTADYQFNKRIDETLDKY
ncbi:hypothetical protein HQ529_03785 [Candidatus Woesearchaeota archaeon]|nr:hypothetical protein [Candidatus Woesearchaeota archaeon]